MRETILPSKELLNAVLSKTLKKHNLAYNEVTECGYEEEYNVVIINYLTNDGIIQGYTINIYELAHRCKQWAHENGYELKTDSVGLIKIYTLGSTYPILPTPFHNNSIYETQAIFKACQWILESKRDGIISELKELHSKKCESCSFIGTAPTDCPCSNCRYLHIEE